MADFSKYETPAPEWVKLQQQKVPSSELPTSTVDARDVYNVARAKLQKDFYGIADDVQIDELTIPTPGGTSIPARLYRPKNAGKGLLPLYIRLHSGGFHLGTVETDEPFCAHLCSAFTKTDPTGTGIAVLNPVYHHTPEYIFPTQPNEVWAAFDLFASEDSGEAAKYGIDAKNIYVGGTSAGGTLAIGITVREMRRIQQQQNEQGNPATKPTSRVKGLIVTAPATVHPSLFPYHLLAKRESASYIQNAIAPVLPFIRLKAFTDMYMPDASEETKADEQLSSLLIPEESFDKDLWPPTTFHISGLDTLRDDGLLFAEKLKRVGVETRVAIYEGFPHGFNLFPQLKETEKWEEAKLEELRWLIGKQREELQN